MTGIRIGIRTAALAALVVSTGARAGVEIAGTETVGKGRNMEKAEIRILLDGDLIRMDRKGKKSEMSVLFDSKSRVLTLLDHKGRSFTEMTPEDVRAMKNKLTSMMNMIEGQLKSMPASQRAQMEKMLKEKGMMPGGKNVEKREVKYVSLARQSRTGSWNTAHYEARVGVERVAEYRVASWQDLGIAKSEFRAIEALQKFGKEMFEGLPQGVIEDSAFAALNVEMPGFAVKVVNYKNRVNVQSSVEYTRIAKKTVASGDLAVPQGYSKKPFPKM